MVLDWRWSRDSEMIVEKCHGRRVSLGLAVFQSWDRGGRGTLRLQEASSGLAANGAFCAFRAWARLHQYKTSFMSPILGGAASAWPLAQSALTDGHVARSLIKNPCCQWMNLAADTIYMRSPCEEFPEQVARTISSIRNAWSS